MLFAQTALSGQSALLQGESADIVQSVGIHPLKAIAVHVLEYLRDPSCARRPQDLLCAEYRLICSGTIYRDITGDWSKSEEARLLLAPPLLLYAASRPFDEYPLELVLRLRIARAEQTHKGPAGATMTTVFHPDAEVARDLAALLTMLCRRLITVAGKSTERHGDYRHPVFEYLPMPLATSMRKVYWPPHPLTILTSFDGGQQVRDNNPAPTPLDPGALTALLGLPRLEHAESIVASARLYAQALELIRDKPDIAYQLLISAVETIANQTLQNCQPDDDAKVSHRQGVYKLAKELGLGEQEARNLAVEACKAEHWATRKFRKFLTDNIDDSIWEKEDDLFRLPLEYLPRREDLHKTLGNIYDARSKATHWGQQFPVSASYSGGPTLPVPVMVALFSPDSAFPPVAWFERIVNIAIRTFWERSVEASPAAAVEEAPPEATPGSGPVAPKRSRLFLITDFIKNKLWP